MRPDTLPPSYNRWLVLLDKHCPHALTPSYRIQVASKVPEDAVRINKSLVREGWFDPADMERLLSHQVSHPFLAL